MPSFNFSGHESFICKQFWLKKGFDFLQSGKRFSDKTSVVDLGVGKNMVNSIRFWVRAFGLVNGADEPNDFSQYILSDNNGKDPYLEDFGTLWLLHYSLVKSQKASLYNVVFNNFRKERFEFTKTHFTNFVNRHCGEVNKKTLETDIGVFIRNYLRPQYSKTDVEDDFSRLLTDLELASGFQLRDEENKLIDWYKIESQNRTELPYQVMLYSILDNENWGDSISFKGLRDDVNSPGAIFCLNSEGLYEKVKKIESNYPDIIFSETAGNQELQFKSKPNKWDVLNDYYQN